MTALWIGIVMLGYIGGFLTGTWRAIRDRVRQFGQVCDLMCEAMHPGQTHDQAWGRDR